MVNAKQELLSLIEERNVLCAYIEYEYDYDKPLRKISLRRNYRKDNWEAFLQALDFVYDNGYGSQVLFGKIWFTNGTWADRHEYDGSECWVIRQIPAIPEHL